jgi:protein CpxP
MKTEYIKGDYNMKKMLCILALSGLMSAKVLAEDTVPHNKMDQSGMSEKGMMMNMMSHEQMMTMHEHMQTMEAMMTKIKNEKDPEKRRALMEEHMQAMQNGMHMMNGGMKMGTKPSKMDEMDMDKRIDMMGQKMGMMQKIMEQMMEHAAQANKDSEHHQ